MPREDEIRSAIANKWKCIGFYGYGIGATLREFDKKLDVCTNVCPLQKQCWALHKAKTDVRYPDLTRIRNRAMQRARDEGRRYVLADYGNELSQELKRPLEGAEPVDPWLIENGRNIEAGLEGLPPNVRES